MCFLKLLFQIFIFTSYFQTYHDTVFTNILTNVTSHSSLQHLKMEVKMERSNNYVGQLYQDIIFRIEVPWNLVWVLKSVLIFYIEQPCSKVAPRRVFWPSILNTSSQYFGMEFSSVVKEAKRWPRNFFGAKKIYESFRIDLKTNSDARWL